ncbi:hypothetical protein Tco_1063540 [Tanacetum coccineum]
MEVMRHNLIKSGTSLQFWKEWSLQAKTWRLLIHLPCYSPSTPTILETITPTDSTRDSPVITLFHDDPYMFVRVTPLSPDYTPASLDYTPDTPHSDEESEPLEASDPGDASPHTHTLPSDSTTPLSFDHPLTQTSPTNLLELSITVVHAFYDTSPPSKPPALPQRKRYRGTSEHIAEKKSESEESEGRSTDSESAKAASED